jgi:hypothetical protein
MKKPTLLISTAWILHAAAWFLPVLKGQDFRPPTVGWKAFRLAACAIWPCKGVQFETVHHEVLATVSVVTTLLFVLCSPWIVMLGPRSLRRLSAWVSAAAFVFNMHWIVIFGPQWSQLTVGYFAWLFSFLLLAVGLFVSSRIVLGQRAVE